MSQFLDKISAFFSTLGIHPVLGAFLLGVIFVLVIRRGGDKPATVENSIQVSLSSPATGGINGQSARVAIGEKEHELTPEVFSNIVTLLRQSQKIDAIKAIRKALGVGLYEGKLIAEALDEQLKLTK